MNKSVHRYGVLELCLQSDVTYTHPDLDCRVIADFTGPAGKTVSVRAFWDGGRTWRVRFSPDETGRWIWRTRCPTGGNPGLHRDGESFECVDYRGENVLYRHGPLKVSEDGRTFCHADGTPFFWLGDTAWNGVIRGDDDKWRRYLGVRAGQQFTVIQFVASHWRGTARDETGERACDEGHPIRINPAFFKRLDSRVAMINDFGLVAAPVVLWSFLETDPGYKLQEEDATRLASYIVARYDAYHVAWLLGGDGDYLHNGTGRWKHIGRAVFDCGHKRPVTLHPCGQSWIGEEFRKEPWYTFIGYQSGHGDGDDHLEWLVKGPPAAAWKNQPVLPVINLEPNYETAHGYHHKTVFTGFHVRRAAYWSLLVSPTAGLTYGHDAVWNWNFKTGPSEGHGDWHGGAVPPWHTGLRTPGIHSMTILRSIFNHLDWTTMKPYQHLLAGQPGDRDVSAFITAGRNAGGSVMIYSPKGEPAVIAPGVRIPGPLSIVDPGTGESVRTAAGVENRIDFPDGRDWLAICGKGNE